MTETKGGLLDSLNKKLKSDGFSVSRDIQIGSFRVGILAVKHRFEVAKLTDMSTLVMISEQEDSGIERAREYFSTCASYALAHHKSVFPRGLGGGVFSVNAIASSSFSLTMLDWIAKATPTKHWAAFEFPVLISTDDRKLHYYDRTPMWGRAYWKGFRAFVDGLFLPEAQRDGERKGRLANDL